jgi:penicillin-insensitive murein endopeptidase
MRRLVVLAWSLLTMAANAAETPAPGPTSAIGATNRGCLQGATALPQSGPGWQVLRPDHNRFWGTPTLIAVIEAQAAQLPSSGGGLLIGDMSLPRGGRMPSGHASHQTGLDADILFRLTDHPLTAEERDDPDLTSVLAGGQVSPQRWGAPQEALLKHFAEDPRVDRIFVNPVIKRHLCQSVKGERGWLHRIRPWYGHAAHFHVRLACPAGDAGCEPQAPIPEGDGCGADLTWWFSPEANQPAPSVPTPASPPPRYSPSMPAACKTILPGN